MNNIVLESDIIEAYVNNEIDQYDIINLFDYGFISENTIEYLIDEDDYIAKAFEEAVYNLEPLEEGAFKRGLRNMNPFKNHHLNVAKYYNRKAEDLQKKIASQGGKDYVKHAAKIHSYLDKAVKHSATHRAKQLVFLRKQVADSQKYNNAKAEKHYQDKLNKLKADKFSVNSKDRRDIRNGKVFAQDKGFRLQS